VGDSASGLRKEIVGAPRSREAYGAPFLLSKPATFLEPGWGDRLISAPDTQSLFSGRKEAARGHNGSVVRFWLANKVSEDRLETEFFLARLGLAERAAFEAGLEKFEHLSEDESIYWFEGTLAQVVTAVTALGENYGLTNLGVEVSDRELAAKWPVKIKVGMLAVGVEEIPGRGERRLRASRRENQRATPEPSLESEIKRDFMPR
jgi:hypothetical protein